MLILLIDIYHRIFVLLSNLKYLDLDVNNNYLFSKSLLNALSFTTCVFSSISHLRIKLHNFDDCLCLLDGRLNQLHTFIIKLEYVHDPSLLRRTPSEIIHNSSILLNNTVKKSNTKTFSFPALVKIIYLFYRKNLVKLKCFSLFVCLATSEFDSLVAPLLRRMSHLEKLTLTNKLRRLLVVFDVHSLKEDIMLIVTLIVIITLTGCKVDAMSVRFFVRYGIYSAHFLWFSWWHVHECWRSTYAGQF